MFVKICCIQSEGEARRALAAGANAIGLVAEMPTATGVIADSRIREIVATLAPDVAHETAEAALKDALQAIATEGISDGELARARRQVVADEAFGRDGPYAVVSQLNEAIAVGDWTLFADYRDRIEAVTAADVQAAATAILDDDRLTVAWYVPDEG